MDAPSHQPDLTPLSGWVLPLVLRLDEAAPGFLRQLTKARLKRRQAICFVLAHDVADQPDRLLERLLGCDISEAPWAEVQSMLAHALLDAEPPSIVEAVHGWLPDGLLGALGKIGARPLSSPEHYRDLWRLFSDPAEHRRRRVLLQASEIDSVRLATLLAVPSVLVHAGVLKADARNPSQAEDLRFALDFVRRYVPSATEDRIACMVADLGERKLAGVLCDLLEQAVFAPPPFGDHREIEWLTDARKLAATGREYRNCLGGKLMEVVGEGVAYYAVMVDGSAVLEFRRTVSGWVFGEAYGPGNSEVAASVLDRVYGVVGELGAVNAMRIAISEDAERFAGFVARMRESRLDDFLAARRAGFERLG